MHGNIIIPSINYPKDLMGYFAQGYYHGAKILAETILSNNHICNNEAYPVIFLYRTSLELYLKSVIYLSQKRHQEEENLINSHEFKRILEMFNPIFKNILPYDDALLISIKACCSFFEEHDPKSFSYRYPIDVKGNPASSKNQVINLPEVYVLLNPVLEDLDTMYFGLSNDL